jgi:hypothetical protein
MIEIRAVSKTILALNFIINFAELDPVLLEELASAAIQQKYEAGQVVFPEGESCLKMYLVQDGWMKRY